MAVGQFTWELNSLVHCSWPETLSDLHGCAWVSLDGLSWTTMPFVNNNSKTDLFWQCYRIDNVDTTRDMATLITDTGMFMFNVQQTMRNVVNLFENGPIMDFTTGPNGAIRNPNQCILATPVGLSGPFAAQCTYRDATGTCIKCLNNNGNTSTPANIPQIIGTGGVIQPNFDVCISAVAGDDTTGTSVYTSVDSAVDAFAISAYAGYNPGPQTASNQMIANYQQSFFSESPLGPSNDTIIICPQYSDPGQTPSSVIGADAHIADLMQCAIDNAMALMHNNLTAQNTTQYTNVNGSVFVRRAGNLQEPLIYSVGGSLDWTTNYIKESRWITMTPYDTFVRADKNREYMSLSCPSTLGLGGSAIVPPEIKSSSAYPVTQGPNSLLYNAGTFDSESGLRDIIKNKITNLGAFSVDPSGPYEGPFLQNKSLESTAQGNWAPGMPPYDRAVLANDEILSDFGYANQNTSLVFNGSKDPTQKKQTQNPYLYRLSSFEFPYDARASDLNGIEITIGRDPQVYEPGFGPLQSYISDQNMSCGFSRSDYNQALMPWPANPLPEEGLGRWWIRPSSFAKTALSTGYGLFQAALGYGTIIFQQQLGFYNTSDFTHQGYAIPTNNVQLATQLFMYDTETTTNNYLSPNSLNWTKYLPYQNKAPNTFDSTNVINNPWTLDLQNSPRALRALYSIQNVMSLRLANAGENVPVNTLRLSTLRNGQTSSNWKYLVGLNFFRPRNWGFTGFVDGEELGNGVTQQVVASDQPNSDGLYEFLVPDPFYAAVPTMTSYGPRNDILGIRTLLHGPSASDTADYNLMQSVMVNGGALPKSLQIIETTSLPNGTANYLRHSAFHYWTIDATKNSATLDLYINVTKMFADLSDVSGPSSESFQWLDCTLPDTYNFTDLPNILGSYLNPSSSQKAQDLIAKLINYNGNPQIGGPQNSFTWSDPSNQTTRSLNSISLQGLNVNFVNTELIMTVDILPSGLAKRQSKPPTQPVKNDYSNNHASLLRHTYIIPNLAAGTNTLNALTKQNLNSVSIFGLDSFKDPRGFTAQDNFSFTPKAKVINITSSDYLIENDNSAYFCFRKDPINQDLMAQTAQDGNQYGSISLGFGLRIDSDALQLETRDKYTSPKNSVTNADLPMDHGYVSFVRTIVDSQERYTDITNGQLSVDAVPHVARLTYVTKYVPSKLQAYGAIVPYQPMRFVSALGGPNEFNGTQFESALFQNIHNPFRTPSTYLIEQVFYGPNSQSLNAGSRWLRPTVYGPLVNGLQTDLYWAAFSSAQFDVESPGYWGRQKMPIIYDTATAYFDSAGNPILNNIYTKAATINDIAVPFAGYDGVWDQSTLFIAQTDTSKINSFRTAFTQQQFIDACLNTATPPITGTANYIQTLTGRPDAIVGQMLVNLLDAAPLLVPTNDTSQNIRIELAYASGSEQDVVRYRGLITVNKFMADFVYNSGGAYQTYFGVLPSGPILVTHKELGDIICLGLSQWISNDVGIALSPRTIVMASIFDPLKDRSSFTVASASIAGFRLFMPRPLSLWLGMCAIQPPMFNLNDVPDGIQLHWNNKITSLFSTHENDYQKPPNGDTQGWNQYYREYLFQTNPSWNFNTQSYFISPADWSRINFNMNKTFDPAQGSCPWGFGEGPPVPQNFYFDGSNFLMQYFGACVLFSTVGLSMNASNFATWTGSDTQTYRNNTFTAPGSNANISQGMVSGQVSQPLNLKNGQKIIACTYNGSWKSSLNGSDTSWTSNGWSDQSSTPLYNLYYEFSGTDSGVNTIIFDGTLGIASDGSRIGAQQQYYCDIANNSWSTRLASGMKNYNGENISHWWGIVCEGTNKLALNNSFDCYHADSSLTVIVNGMPVQVLPRQPQFMNANGASDNITKAININNSTSAVPYLIGAYIPAIEVPCPYGNVGSESLQGSTKPANYDSLINSIGSSSGGLTGCPRTDLVVSTTSSINYDYATRQTYGILNG